MTDEILLREMADDPLLHRYNFVIIDEMQERSLATDVLLALFKYACYFVMINFVMYGLFYGMQFY